MGNCYFTFGDKVFRQVIGIPMGPDPAPFMANLFLFYYESKWVKNLKRDSQKWEMCCCKHIVIPLIVHIHLATLDTKT